MTAPTLGWCYYQSMMQIEALALTDTMTANGAAAYADGQPAAPFLDPTVRTAIESLPVGAGAAGIMKAWLNGWHTANLAAVVG